MTCQSLTSRTGDERMLRPKVERDYCQCCSLSLPPSLNATFPCLYGGAAVPSSCARNSHLSGDSSVLQKRGRRSAAVLCRSRRAGRGDEGLTGCWLFGLLYRFPQSSCRCAESQSGAASAPAADESCTCCAHREQAQDSSPPSPPPPPPTLHPPSCTPCALP